VTLDATTLLLQQFSQMKQSDLLAAAQDFRVRDVFGPDRVPKEVSVQRWPWTMTRETLRILLRDTAVAARCRTQPGKPVCTKCDCFNIYVDIQRNSRGFREVSLSIFDARVMDLCGDPDPTVCEFSLLKQKNNWNLHHRNVRKELRGNGIFAECLRCMEDIVTLLERQRGRTDIRIAADVRQPMTMARFLQKGFTPASRKDEKRVWDVFGGARHLVCDWGHDYDWTQCAYVPDTSQSMLCFRKDDVSSIEDLTYANAMRVLLWKQIEVGSPDEDQVRWQECAVS
jgi:hypothetical protein